MPLRSESNFLAIDYGEKRIGLATAHSISRIAHPYKTIANSGNRDIFDKILKIINHEKIAKIIVGLPRNMDGSAGFQAVNCQKFAESLAAAVFVPVVFQEETLSSVEAKKTFSSKSIDDFGIDAAAATIILDRFLENGGTIE